MRVYSGTLPNRVFIRTVAAAKRLLLINRQRKLKAQDYSGKCNVTNGALYIYIYIYLCTEAAGTIIG
jgi:hypothetical protein